MIPELVQTVLTCYPTIKTAWVAGYGEATLNPHLPRIIDILLANNVDTTLITNGTLLTKLHKDLPWRKIHTSIALNAANPGSYREVMGADRYYDVISGLQMLRTLKAKVSVSFRVSRKTLEGQMTAFLEFAKHYPNVPVSMISISNWIHGLADGETPDEWLEHALFDDDSEAQKIVRYMRAQAVGMQVDIHAWPRFIRRDGPPTGPCMWPFNHIGVDSNGDVRACCNIIQELEPPPNIYKSRVQTWYDKPLLELRQRVQRGGGHMPKTCWQCIAR